MYYASLEFKVDKFWWKVISEYILETELKNTINITEKYLMFHMTMLEANHLGTPEFRISRSSKCMKGRKKMLAWQNNAHKWVQHNTSKQLFVLGWPLLCAWRNTVNREIACCDTKISATYKFHHDQKCILQYSRGGGGKLPVPSNAIKK